jgi:hypothetical protein
MIIKEVHNCKFEIQNNLCVLFTVPLRRNTGRFQKNNHKEPKKFIQSATKANSVMFKHRIIL